ncbi:MAG: hypothetical protein DI538_12475 [Azospira oryzae]|nr:MAG: hypothetical protein DI538_12475 [Azospira oryzae]
MRFILVLIVAIGLSGCFSEAEEPETYIDPELSGYVTTFFEEAAKRGISIEDKNFRIGFGSVEGEAQGMTYYATRSIVIEKESEGYKLIPEALVYHELGHLFLHRTHDDSMIGQQYKCAKSLMDSRLQINGGQWYVNRRAYYVSELFNPHTSLPDWAF